MSVVGWIGATKDTYQRLRAIKARVDPHGLFRPNHPI